MRLITVSRMMTYPFAERENTFRSRTGTVEPSTVPMSTALSPTGKDKF